MVKTLWIARDKDGWLYMYEHKPIKARESFYYDEESVDGYVCKFQEDFLPEITWENSPMEVELKLNKG